MCILEVYNEDAESDSQSLSGNENDPKAPAPAKEMFPQPTNSASNSFVNIASNEDKRSTRLSSLVNQKLETNDVMRAAICAVIMVIAFTVTFRLWNTLGIRDLLPACGTYIVSCDCPEFKYGFLWSMRAVTFFGIPTAFFITTPFAYYQKFPRKIVAALCGNFVLSVFFSCLMLRRLPLPAQICSVTLLSSIGICVVAYTFGGMQSVKECRLLIWVCTWGILVAAVNVGIAFVDTAFYPYILPIFTLLCDVSFIRISDQFLAETNPLAASVVFFTALGIVSGTNFNAFITASNLSDLAITTAVAITCEVILKCYPAWYASTGGEIPVSEILYYKVVVYVEYIPPMVYVMFVLSDFSPLGGMVESQLHGCSGSPLIKEFHERYIVCLVMVFSEMTSDFASYILIQKLWKAGNLAKPFKSDNWIQVFFMIGSAIVGCIAGIEGGAVIFKESVRGGII